MTPFPQQPALAPPQANASALVSPGATQPQPAPTPMVQSQIAPPYAPQVIGGYGFKVPPEMSQRVSAFLTGYNTPKRFESVVVVPNEKWSQFLYDMQTSPSAGRAQAVSNIGTKRAYLNADSFKELDPNSGVEWLLAHELQHFNDPRNAMLQKKSDRDIDVAAKAALAKWLKIQQGQK